MDATVVMIPTASMGKRLYPAMKTCRYWLTFMASVVFAFSAGTASAGSTIDAAHPYAWAANAGWVNARADGTNGAVIGQWYCTGLMWSANCGWISLGKGPTNHWWYSNTSSNDWGVNHDGQGRLSGYAYGANIGWIVFEQTYGQPRIDLQTGIFRGFAWSANMGWISFSNAQAYVRTERLDSGPDTDDDGLPDAYEYAYANSLDVLDGRMGKDSDGDGATDLQEAGADTDPLDSASCLELTAITRLPNTTRLTWTVEPTRYYRLEQSMALTNALGWADSGLGQITPDPGAVMTCELVDQGSTNRHYRVRAIVPLSE